MSELLNELEPLILLMFAVFFRVAAFLALLPGFGESSVSARIKLGLAFALTIIVYPLVPITQISIENTLDLVSLVAMETVAGALLGIGVRLLLMGLQTAGTIAAQATSLSQVFGPAGVEPLPAIGHVLVVSGIALAMMAGLHVNAAALFVVSYDFFPFATGISGSNVADWGVEQVAHAFRLAFSLAIPFVVLSMLYNLALGVINKAMPQLMVAFVGAPAITLGGLFLFFSSAPIMLEVWHNALEGYMNNPLAAR
ncbi:flagellar biosynthetic protein FliR [Roseobacteraceae bacterium S113]